MDTRIVSAIMKDHALKATGDFLSYGIIFGTFVKILPPLAAIISIAWAVFQFWHHPVVVEWREKRKEKCGK